MIRIGIDIGSTTVKVVALDETDRILFSKYERHHARAKEILIILLQELQAKVGIGNQAKDNRFGRHGICRTLCF